MKRAGLIVIQIVSARMLTEKYPKFSVLMEV